MTCLKLKGLPFEATEQDINDFFSGSTVIGLLMCTNGVKRTGEAYVEFATLFDLVKVNH